MDRSIDLWTCLQSASRRESMPKGPGPRTGRAAALRQAAPALGRRRRRIIIATMASLFASSELSLWRGATARAETVPPPASEA